MSSTVPHFAATCHISLLLYIFCMLPYFLTFACFLTFLPLHASLLSYFPDACYFSCSFITLSYNCSFFLSFVFHSPYFVDHLLRSVLTMLPCYDILRRSLLLLPPAIISCRILAPYSMS